MNFEVNDQEDEYIKVEDVIDAFDAFREVFFSDIYEYFADEIVEDIASMLDSNDHEFEEYIEACTIKGYLAEKTWG